ncbi:uncharacterized protein LOC142490796 [Ascaphus truei]|uniref:uncharacterized protein LOC142490796 n=1 Tax=Ascaphus truei TaxID=8439 RepID=UPI003F5A0A11
MSEFAPGGHVSPEMEQVSSPGSASSTLLEEHHGDEDDEYDEDDATEETEIQSCDHEEVPIETVVPPNRPSTSTYDAIVASEGKIVDAENRRHSDMMTVLERMIGLQEETVSQLAHLHRVFIEVPKQLQKINTSFEALVVQQTQANYWRMTNVPQFNTSQPGSVHAGQFSPHSSDIHSPGPNVTGQVADIAVQVPDDILPLPSVQIQQQTPTKEATKTKQDTHETDQPSLVQCLPTCSHVSLGTSPVREQSLPKSPVGESLPKSPVGESLPKSPCKRKRRQIQQDSVGDYNPQQPQGLQPSDPKQPIELQHPLQPGIYTFGMPGATQVGRGTSEEQYKVVSKDRKSLKRPYSVVKREEKKEHIFKEQKKRTNTYTIFLFKQKRIQGFVGESCVLMSKRVDEVMAAGSKETLPAKMHRGLGEGNKIHFFFKLCLSFLNEMNPVHPRLVDRSRQGEAGWGDAVFGAAFITSEMCEINTYTEGFEDRFFSALDSCKWPNMKVFINGT